MNLFGKKIKGRFEIAEPLKFERVDSFNHKEVDFLQEKIDRLIDQYYDTTDEKFENAIIKLIDTYSEKIEAILERSEAPSNGFNFMNFQTHPNTPEE